MEPEALNVCLGQPFLAEIVVGVFAQKKPDLCSLV